MEMKKMLECQQEMFSTMMIQKREQERYLMRTVLGIEPTFDLWSSEMREGDFQGGCGGRSWCRRYRLFGYSCQGRTRIPGTRPRRSTTLTTSASHRTRS